MTSKSSQTTDAGAFAASLGRARPPAGLDGALQALWHAAKGDWNKAHDLAQTEDNDSGAWVHAYLHRVEGDLSNADYWYCRAGRKRPRSSLDDEWRAIAEALLDAARDRR
jgi:hypothetical protein